MAKNYLKLAAIVMGGLGAIAGAYAQFLGPAPVAWRWQQPLTTTSISHGSPVVDGQTVIVADQQRVYALNLSDGNQIWRYPAGDPLPAVILSTPAVGNGTVYALASNRILYAIDEATGQTKWVYNSPGSFTGDPVFTKDAVFFALGDGSIMGVKTSDGTPYYDTPLVINDGLSGQIAILGNDIICFNGSNKLLAINYATRKLDWNIPFTSAPPNPHPVVYGNNIYTGAGGYVVSISATGQANWTYNLGNDIAFWPAVGPSGVAVVTPDGDVYTFDNSGKPTSGSGNQGSLSIPMGMFPQTAPTAVGDSSFIFTGAGGNEILVNVKKSQSPIWNYIIRPIGGVYKQETTTGGAGGLGGSGGGPSSGGFAGGGGSGPSGGGLGGGGGAGGLNGGGAQGQTKNVTEISYIQAASPAVLAGTTLLQFCRDGSLIAFDPTTGVDLTPPDVEMSFPSPGSTVSGQPPLVLVYKIQDYSSGVDPSSLVISIDGKKATVQYTPDGLAEIFFSVDGKNQPLQDGRHVVTVSVADWMGNHEDKEFILNIDNTLPPIQIQGQDTTGKGSGSGSGAGGGSGSTG